MKMKPLPDVEVLRELLTYCPESGVLLWKKARTGVTVGTEAGYIDNTTGYRRITIGQELYATARICWALHYGADPYPMTVDHCDRNRTNNRIHNLRLATPTEQNLNRDNTRMGRRRGVIITYADGGTITARSQTLASYIVGQHRTQINKALARGGILYHPHTSVPNGITLAHA